MSTFLPGTPWSVVNETNQRLYGTTPVAEPPGWATQHIPPGSPGYQPPTSPPPMSQLFPNVPSGYVSPYTSENLAERFPNMPPGMQQQPQQPATGGNMGPQGQRPTFNRPPMMPPMMPPMGGGKGGMGNTQMQQVMPLLALLFGGMGGMGGMRGMGGMMGMGGQGRNMGNMRRQAPPMSPSPDDRMARATSGRPGFMSRG
jgi:hypothetical protein